MVREFIEGWDLLQVLGEGTFAEVKLLVNRDTGEACAMKEINISENPRADKSAKKEICVHKLLKHPNIVQCYGSRVEAERQFIFLEYCNGGELFDRIGKTLLPWLANFALHFTDFSAEPPPTLKLLLNIHYDFHPPKISFLKAEF